MSDELSECPKAEMAFGGNQEVISYRGWQMRFGEIERRGESLARRRLRLVDVPLGYAQLAELVNAHPGLSAATVPRFPGQSTSPCLEVSVYEMAGANCSAAEACGPDSL